MLRNVTSPGPLRDLTVRSKVAVEEAPRRITRAEQVSSHTISKVHHTFDNGTEIPVLFGHQFIPIRVRIHFSVPTRIQHFHVRLWHIILMHQGETSIFVVQKSHPTAVLETLPTMFGEWYNIGSTLLKPGFVYGRACCVRKFDHGANSTNPQVQVVLHVDREECASNSSN